MKRRDTLDHPWLEPGRIAIRRVILKRMLPRAIAVIRRNPAITENDLRAEVSAMAIVFTFHDAPLGDAEWAWFRGELGHSFSQ
jgi:hypothetical protein